MRKFVKTAAVLALALALLSTSAFAATTLTGSVVKGSVDGTYTANISGANANEQITILAVDSVGDGNTVPELTDSNILYINQMAATSGAGAFENFTLKGESNGRTIHFFAGSATSDEAKYLGYVTEAIPYTVEIEDGVTVEVNQTEEIAATIAPAGYTGPVTWAVVSDNAASATITGDAIAATFTATVDGTYTVRATLDNGAYDEADVVVTAKDVTVAAPTVTIVNALATDAESTAKNQNGLGVALKFADLKAGFTHMIWAFGDGTDNPLTRKYSTKIALDESASGAVTFMAAFGNGTANGSITPYDVQEVDALFWDGTDTYFTNEALDGGNELNK